MNEAMPQWRTFSSNAPVGQEHGADPPQPPAPHSTRQNWLVAVLTGLGGLAAGVALAMLAVVALDLMPPAERVADFGEPLDAGPPLPAGLADSAPGNTDIVVDVAGAVARPGLHRLASGDRVGDAIEAAGGFAPRADLAVASQTLNLAQTLEDGSKVLVPELGIDRPTEAAPGDGRIDLNRAGQEELESLPGVGPVTARKIIEARAERRFTEVGDLRARGLVGESVYGKLKGLVSAG